MLDVAHLADGRVTGLMNSADFARRQPDGRITLIPRHEGRRSPSRAHHLAAATGGDLDVMNGQADRDGLERKTVAEFRRRRGTADNFRPHLQTDRRQDVTLFAVLILQQSQPGRAQRIIFNRRYVGLDTVFIAFEIDDAVKLLVPPADTAGCDTAKMIPAARFLADAYQAPLGMILSNLIERRHSDVARRRR